MAPVTLRIVFPTEKFACEFVRRVVARVRARCLRSGEVVYVMVSTVSRTRVCDIASLYEGKMRHFEREPEPAEPSRKVRRRK